MPQIFPVATRQPGITVSPNQSIPAGAGNKQYLVQVTAAQSDLDDPAVSFDLRMYLRNPDGTWPTVDAAVHNEAAGVTFQGGPNQGKGGAVTPPPGWYQDGADIAGKVVRFWLNNTGRAVDLGLNADAV